MAINGIVEQTLNKKIDEANFDFNLEDTDWTFNEMEESPACRLLLNKSVENKGKVDWNQSLKMLDNKNLISEKLEDDSFISDNVSNSLESINVKNIELMQHTLKTIPECPSCEEYSIYEDSSNLIPHLNIEIDCEQQERRNSFESKQKKTLTDVKEKFRFS